MAGTLTALDGTLKKSKAKNKLANVKLVYPNARKPLPFWWNPGGVANTEMSRTSHHRNVSAEKRNVR